MTFEVPVDSFCASDLAAVLGSVSKVEFHRQPISHAETFARYGVPGRSFHGGWNGLHAAVNYLFQLGLPVGNPIPWARPPSYEIDWARQFLSAYRSPVVFTPMPGGFKNPNDLAARSKFLPPQFWSQRTQNLERDHDILYFTSHDNHVPIPHTIPLLGFPVAKIAAVMFVAGQHMGVENGLLHLAVAMGAQSHVFVPTVGMSKHHCFAAYAYTEEMWAAAGESPRVVYHLFSEVGYIP